MKPYRFVRKLLWHASMLGLDKGPHVTRYFLYEHLARVSGTLPANAGTVVSISKSENLADLLGIQIEHLVRADYPNEDFLSLSFDDESCDFVLSDQVLEHVAGSPDRAIAECYRILKPGGVAVHTTCFMNPIHGSPSDFWRFTPDALRLLHADWSRIIDVGGWGNQAVWSVVRDGMRFAGVPHARWHPLHRVATSNDPEWPIVTWIIAQK